MLKSLESTSNLTLKNVSEVQLRLGAPYADQLKITNPAYHIYGNSNVPPESYFYEMKPFVNPMNNQPEPEILVRPGKSFFNRVCIPVLDENSIQMKQARPIILEAGYYFAFIYGREIPRFERAIMQIRAIKLLYDAAKIISTCYRKDLQEYAQVQFIVSSCYGLNSSFYDTCRDIFFAIKVDNNISNVLYTRKQLYEELVYIGNMYFALLHSRYNCLRTQNGFKTSDADLANDKHLFTKYERLEYPNKFPGYIGNQASKTADIKKYISLAHQAVYGKKLDVFLYFNVSIDSTNRCITTSLKRDYKSLKVNKSELARMKQLAEHPKPLTNEAIDDSKGSENPDAVKPPKSLARTKVAACSLR